MYKRRWTSGIMTWEAGARCIEIGEGLSNEGEWNVLGSGSVEFWVGLGWARLDCFYQSKNT